LKPRVLFLVPADYDELRRKGTDRMIQERDEDGFFERVITIHPLARQARTVDLSPIHRIHEFPLGRALGSQPSGIRARLSAPFRLAAVFRAVVRIARDERIDLVRATDPYLMGLLAWRVSRALKVPFCVSLHADYTKRFALTPKRAGGAWLRRAARILPSFVFPRAHMVLPIRQHMVAPIERAGGRRSAIRVIPHGIDLAPFTAPLQVDARALFRIPPGAAVISFVGRLAGDNYAADIAEIVERVARRRRDVVFVLVGEGPEEGQLRRRLIEQSGVAEAVRLLPFQPYDRVVALRRISTASLCLMGGFSLIEACAAGSPAVAYDVEWHADLVEDGVTGFLIQEHDVDAAVAALERLIDDPVRAAAMGRQGQLAAFARHDLRVTSQIKRACYAQLLNGRRSLAG
jgi:glycosyltransferase involved in cell wall biosynthesis